MRTTLNRLGFSTTGFILLIILALLPFIPPFNSEYILRWLIAGAFLGAQAIAFDLTQGYINVVNFGFAAIVGKTDNNDDAVSIIRGLQERNILVFMAGHSDGRAIAEQLAEENIEMNWDTFLVPYGKDITSAVLALGFAARSAMTFGGIQPKGMKEARDILFYNKERVILAKHLKVNINEKSEDK